MATPNTKTTDAAKLLNRAIWDKLFSVDEGATSKYKGKGGYQGVAIKAYWVMMRMTEEFGPVGKGWGWDEVDNKTYTATSGAAIWMSKVIVWYTLDGKRYETGPQWGGTDLLTVRAAKDGREAYEFLDEDAAKKAITDAVSKCCSYLGAGGEVHMGLFDDNKYMSEKKDEAAASKRPVKVAPETVVLWRNTTEASAKACKTSAELKKLWDGEKGTAKKYGESDDAETKNAANYVKTQITRILGELKAKEAPAGTTGTATGEATGTAADTGRGQLANGEESREPETEGQPAT